MTTANWGGQNSFYLTAYSPPRWASGQELEAELKLRPLGDECCLLVGFPWLAQPSFYFSRFLNLWICVFCLHVCTSEEALHCWNYSYRHCWVNMWVLGFELTTSELSYLSSSQSAFLYNSGPSTQESFYLQLAWPSHTHHYIRTMPTDLCTVQPDINLFSLKVSSSQMTPAWCQVDRNWAAQHASQVTRVWSPGPM